MDLDKLRREEQELTDAMYGPQTTNPVGENPTAPVAQESEPTQEVIVQPPSTGFEEAPTVVVEDPPTPKKERVSWKNRYASYKAATDATIHELRLEKANLTERVLTLEGRVAEAERAKAEVVKAAQEATKEPMFTQEDIDILGPEAIAIMERAMKSKESNTDNGRVEALEAELQAIKDRELANAKKQREDLVSDSITRLKTKLTELLPEWSDLDVDPRFGKFIKEIDPISGNTREILFQRAMSNQDVGRILSFYTEFKGLISPPEKEDVLESMITPTGSNVSQNNPDANHKKTYSMRDYRVFMDDLSKGRYKGREKEAKQIEYAFDRAAMEGRMRD